MKYEVGSWFQMPFNRLRKCPSIFSVPYAFFMKHRYLILLNTFSASTEINILKISGLSDLMHDINATIKLSL